MNNNLKVNVSANISNSKPVANYSIASPEKREKRSIFKRNNTSILSIKDQKQDSSLGDLIKYLLNMGKYYFN